MELFTATGKLKKFFFDNQRCSMCAPWVTQHTSTRYSSSCHTQVNMGASIFFTAVMIHAFRHGFVCMQVLCILCTKCTLHSNHRLTRVIFPHTKQLLPRSIHFLTTYSCITQRQKCELRWKTSYWEKNFLSCSFYLYRFRKYMSYGFPIINFCNLGVHYETPCICLIVVQMWLTFWLSLYFQRTVYLRLRC